MTGSWHTTSIVVVNHVDHVLYFNHERVSSSWNNLQMSLTVIGNVHFDRLHNMPLEQHIMISTKYVLCQTS